jgi:hypothetical protein
VAPKAAHKRQARHSPGISLDIRAHARQEGRSAVITNMVRLTREEIEDCLCHGVSADGLRAYASLFPLARHANVYERKTQDDYFVCMGSTCNDDDHERWLNGEDVELLS